MDELLSALDTSELNPSSILDTENVEKTNKETDKKKKLKKEITILSKDEILENRKLRKELRKQKKDEKLKTVETKTPTFRLKVQETDSEPDILMKKNFGWRYKILPKSFEYLATLEDAEKIFNDSKAFRELKNISHAVAEANKNDQLETIMVAFDYNFTKIITDLITFMNTKVLQAFSGEIKDAKECRKILSISHNAIQTARFYANYSNKFCSEFHEINGIKVVFMYLTNDFLIKKYIEYANSPKTENYININRLIRGSIGLLINLSRQYNDFSTKWKECNATKTILSLTEIIKHIEDNQISMYILLSSISSDVEIDEFIGGIDPVISQIVNIIRKIAVIIESGKNIERVKFQFGLEAHEVSRICLSRAWNLGELLNALYHLAVNDKLKVQIYSKYEMKLNINKIVFHGNEFEKICALQLLWQLCFDSKVLNEVSQDTEMFEKIKLFANDTRPEFIKCKKICKGILWLLKPDEVKRKNDKREKHLMISYNKFSRDLCKAIKGNLEKMGYKVWIDIESIHGSSLESMAKAVEESVGVLMCMTENYKQSSNCRAEAEYAFSLGKPIIPLIMQKGYKADGWLGIILGSKIFIDFTKYEFGECMSRLQKEIEPIVKKSDRSGSIDSCEMFSDVKCSQKVDTIKKENVIDWNQDQVLKWLKDNEIDYAIIESLMPCDGTLLNQFYDMQCSCPEFFYNSISQNKQIGFRSVAVFGKELKKLYTKK